MTAFPRFTPVADCAVLVDFGDEMSAQAHAAVTHLDHALAADPPLGMAECVPAFVNVMVVFDPLLTDHTAINAAVTARLTQAVDMTRTPTLRTVDVCYDADLAPDLAEVAKQVGMTEEAVINAHLVSALHVVMYGFAPGYAYLTGLTDTLHLPRKQAAVRDVPAGTVLIAGAQCLVSTVTMPTGWWRIGAAATQVLTGDPAHPFLFDVADPVAFRRIDRTTFENRKKGGDCG